MRKAFVKGLTEKDSFAIIQKRNKCNKVVTIMK